MFLKVRATNHWHYFPTIRNSLPLEAENGNKFSKTSANEITFLGAFVKLRKASSRPSVCPSVRPHGTTRFPQEVFLWNFIFEYFFENLSWRFKFHQNLTRITGYFTWRLKCIYNHISLSSSYKEKCFRQICLEKLNTHFVFNKFLSANIVLFIR
jgi:hypothetical protein